MKKTAQQIIDALNGRLIEFNQSTRVIEYSGKSIKLSTGQVLVDNDKDKFCKRLMNSKTNLWAQNIDLLLSGTVTDKEIRSDLATIGGIAVQKKYPNIKKNLNTGSPWNAGTKGQRIGTLGPRPSAVKKAIGQSNSGKNNGMFGVKMSDKDKQLRSKLMKEKILFGKFTPNSNNKNTHWDSCYKGKKYRSSWEALYQYYNNTAEYESLRIEYGYDNNKHIYIVDFVDHIKKVVIEIKPQELCSDPRFMAKKEALLNWATNHNYQMIIATRKWLLDNIVVNDYTDFDNRTAIKIKAMYATNKKN